MSQFNLFLIFLIAIFINLVLCQTNVNMKILVLTTADFIKYDNPVAIALKSYSIPYDLIAFSATNPPPDHLDLYEKDGRPKYNAVVVNGGSLAYYNESTEMWVSYLNTTQWQYLYDYEAKYNIRHVSISSSLNISIGNALYENEEWGRIKDKQRLCVADNEETKALFNNAQVKITAPLDISGIYHTRININETYSKPILYYAEDDGEKASKAVASTINVYSDNREELSFYFGFGSWSQTCVILNHLWISWVTKNLYNGFRRVYFTPQIDDVFMATDVVDVAHDSERTEFSFNYRNTPFDMDKIIQFQNDITSEMPDGSFYRVELAFNGNGVLYVVNQTNSFEIDGDRYVDLEYVKPAGTGVSRWPIENYTLNYDAEYLRKDKLFDYFYSNDTAREQFFWSSHTFTHENLDDATTVDVDNEIRVNIEFADRIGLTDKKYFSRKAIITPQISGLHNVDAINVFKKYGIEAGTGDLSRSAIINKENPYLPFVTTLESSNFEGFPILPRTPTEIYFLCSTREENTWMYNRIYFNYFKFNSTWDQIAERESKRTLLLMTLLRHEPHQFHQANLRYYESDSGNKYGHSLLEDWTRAVVSLYKKYVNWPLISLKIDDIRTSYVDRLNLENCGQDTQLILDENTSTITGIQVKATSGSCKVPITIPYNIEVDKTSLPKKAVLEQVGSDPLTVWVDLEKGETQSIKFSKAIKW